MKPRFKVGDWVRMSGSSLWCHITLINNGYHYGVYSGTQKLHDASVPLRFDKHWKLVSDEEKAGVL